MGQRDGNDSSELSFSAAMEELEAVLHRIEGDKIDIDQLGTELGRAAKLLEVCREKIRRAEVEVRQIVEQIENEPGAAAAEPAPAGLAATGAGPVRAAGELAGEAASTGVLWSESDVARANEDAQRDSEEARKSDRGLDFDAAREQGNLPGRDDDIPF